MNTIKTNGSKGFTLVEIMIVVAIIGLLATIAIPNFVRARSTAQQNACINNLRQIDSAGQQWALETRQGAQTNAVPAFSDISPYLRNQVTCPAGGSSATFNTSYVLVDVQSKPKCNYVSTHFLPADTTQ